jgi:hypothetical protein
MPELYGQTQHACQKAALTLYNMYVHDPKGQVIQIEYS